MNITSVERAIHSLKEGRLVIVFDDLETQSGSLVGIAEKVNAEHVNEMTKIGQGLVCVCINENTAERLQLPLMVKQNANGLKKNFTVSVDYKTTTTGISAFERSDTIKAMTDSFTQPNDFKKPGHVFPLIGKEKGLLERVDIVEASLDLVKMCSKIPLSFICEILNSKGDIATQEEVQQVACNNEIEIVTISELLKVRKKDQISMFSGTVISGREIGRTIGFPTANLSINQKDIHLQQGVYGVQVTYKDQNYLGVMNVGTRLSLDGGEADVHYEVHIIYFDQLIYGETIDVKVCFLIREEKMFSNLEQLISQSYKDIAYAIKRFRLISQVSVH